MGADFADAELADDAGDVDAAAVARDLARGGGGGGGGSAGASGWLSRRRRAAVASRPLGAPPPLVP